MATRELMAQDRWLTALADHGVRERYADKLVSVPGSECLWWTGAISGRGHGRFWAGPDFVVIAHRFAFAMRHGLDALAEARLLGHRCDNPLCQRIDDGHVVASSALQNRREWVARRDSRDSPLSDPRGARSRAEALRALARKEPWRVREEIERVRAALPDQLALW